MENNYVLRTEHFLKSLLKDPQNQCVEMPAWFSDNFHLRGLYDHNMTLICGHACSGKTKLAVSIANSSFFKEDNELFISGSQDVDVLFISGESEKKYLVSELGLNQDVIVASPLYLDDVLSNVQTFLTTSKAKKKVVILDNIFILPTKEDLDPSCYMSIAPSAKMAQVISNILLSLVKNGMINHVVSTTSAIENNVGRTSIVPHYSLILLLKKNNQHSQLEVVKNFHASQYDDLFPIPQPSMGGSLNFNEKGMILKTIKDYDL